MIPNVMKGIGMLLNGLSIVSRGIRSRYWILEQDLGYLGKLVYTFTWTIFSKFKFWSTDDFLFSKGKNI
jgi:hypothetical protein